jgi:integrase
LALSTVKKVVNTAKRFFTWAKATHAREFRDLPKVWIDALRAPRTVEPAPDHEFVTLEDVLTLTRLEIDEGDLALRRDQAAAALLFLSGMRAGALASLPLKGVDLSNMAIKQWPSLGVKTKNGKRATTYLLPIPELFAAVEKWDSCVRAILPLDAMWYTPTISQFGQQMLSSDPPGANRSVALAKRMRRLFAAAGLPYKSPHKFRHGHAVYALQRARTMADYKAASMNLMHGDIRVTDSIYAPLGSGDVQRRIAGLTGPSHADVRTPAIPANSFEKLTDAQLSQIMAVAAKRLAR